MKSRVISNSPQPIDRKTDIASTSQAGVAATNATSAQQEPRRRSSASQQYGYTSASPYLTRSGRSGFGARQTRFRIS